MKTSDRDNSRSIFFEAWRKYQAKEELQPLEQQIVEIIIQHPEYQKILENPKQYLEKNYSVDLGEINPFLHLGLHLSVIEQLNTDRPAGFRKIYAALVKKLGDNHAAEHQIMQLIAHNLWEMQMAGTAISDEVYLQQLKELLTK